MFGSDVLDVAIGVTLLFLFVSLICSAMQEAIETAMKWRAMDLERGIREIIMTLGQPAPTAATGGGAAAMNQNPVQAASVAAVDGGTPAVAAATGLPGEPALLGTGVTLVGFYNHPFIYSLFRGDYDPRQLTAGGLLSGGRGEQVMRRSARANLPTYIPSKNFSAALLDLVRREAGPDAPLTFASLKAGAAKIANPRLRAAFLAGLSDTQEDIARLRSGIEGWYDASMDRVSGWYKRRTQIILLTIGLATAAVFNIDAIKVARHLANDKAYRDAVVARAGLATAAGNPRPTAAPTEPGEGTEAASGAGADKGSGAGAATPTPATSQADFRALYADLEVNGFIIGWDAPPWSANASGPAKLGSVLLMVLGWCVTALAVSLGAPFWFDLLNKFMVVRSTVKPAEKSGREGSKDGGTSKDG